MLNNSHRANDASISTSLSTKDDMRPFNDLFPPTTTIVVLDTSPARNLAYVTTPPAWVTTFSEMAKNGYSFSLADNAFAELLNQISSGAISAEQKVVMLEHLQTFLNQELPVFPGKRDINALIGIDKTPADWSVRDIRELASVGWQALLGTTTAIAGGLPSAEEELQFEREEWIGHFEKLAEYEEATEPLNEYEHPQLTKALTYYDNTAPLLTPPLSIRWDLQVRLLWRQYVRSKKASNPYDPTSKKKRNDGIDFDLFNYFLLPALVVATDSGFFEKLADINSFQKEWFWKPDVLAAAWIDGKRPCARWP